MAGERVSGIGRGCYHLCNLLEMIFMDAAVLAMPLQVHLASGVQLLGTSCQHVVIIGGDNNWLITDMQLRDVIKVVVKLFLQVVVSSIETLFLFRVNLD